VAEQHRPGRVLVAGSINTDLVARVRMAPAAGETVTGQSFAIFGGGKGANQAVAASRSGAATSMLGALGEDDFGRQRLSDLRADDIDVLHVARLTGVASGVALILVEESGQNRISYIPGATLRVTPEMAVDAAAAAAPSLVLATLELPPESLRTLFEAARRRAAAVMVNASPEPASGRDLAALADILVVNETEAAELLGAPVVAVMDDWAGAARRLLEMGPSSIVVTLGGKGALVADEHDIHRLPAPEVTVVDTTGAGDAFTGAMAAALARGEGVVEAARNGVIAGALAVTRSGAQPSMPTRAAIEQFREEHGNGALSDRDA